MRSRPPAVCSRLPMPIFSLTPLSSLHPYRSDADHRNDVVRHPTPKLYKKLTEADEASDASDAVLSLRRSRDVATLSACLPAPAGDAAVASVCRLQSRKRALTNFATGVAVLRNYFVVVILV